MERIHGGRQELGVAQLGGVGEGGGCVYTMIDWTLGWYQSHWENHCLLTECLNTQGVSGYSLCGLTL